MTGADAAAEIAGAAATAADATEDNQFVSTAQHANSRHCEAISDVPVGQSILK
jgi:hypothetical protein